jgi:hypothetical protein
LDVLGSPRTTMLIIDQDEHRSAGLAGLPSAGRSGVAMR